MARLHNGSEFNDAFEIISVSINHNRVYRYLQNRNTYETTDIKCGNHAGCVYEQISRFPQEIIMEHVASKLLHKFELRIPGKI